MRIEVLNVSKFRTTPRVGDDVPVILPGAMFAIFDGATDPRGTIIDGIGAGRLAALTAAAAAAALVIEPSNLLLPGAEIVARLSQALSHRTSALDLPIPPSTTVAMALDCGENWRFLLLGDTGIRINATEVLHSEKLIDRISTTARVAVFKMVAAAAPITDATEHAARRAILLGFDTAVAEGVLPRQTADGIIAATIADLGLERHAAAVAEFLSGGIKTQFRLSNDPDHPFGFDTLNGEQPRRGDLIEVSRPKSEVRSIELFTDGYPSIPEEVSVAAWESSFAQAETADPHKIGRFATVKGSTATEFFDDRTVVVIEGLGN